ncbi:biopolymer transporter ExbD [uncultured Cohaesibacter sp.]|uniref:biopolymer transporter ExbD n=1 Tax=uncultured Cohaesibacter sp. TaxID=1002546 RepID=UPI0029C9180C|nr:biopolymer transporter ExbD [uncultured Cohaesibacter sp.]
MRLEATRKRRSIVGLTSLIDVIFLLLLFFMLSSTFSRYSELDLGVAGGGTGRGQTPKLIISVSTEEGVRLNGKVANLSDPDVALASFIAEGVTSAVVVPKGDVKLQTLVSLLQDLRNSQLKIVSLAN